MNQVINFNSAFEQVSQPWTPKIVAQLNNYHFKIAKLKGEFIWHSHDETDEAFIVTEGSLKIHLRIDGNEQTVELSAGEMYVVPKGVDHKPYAENECKVLLIEPDRTVNTGSEGGERTVDPAWIT